MINYIFIGVVAFLLLIMLIVGTQLYYDVSLKQKRKKFSYVFKVIMKKGSEYNYEFYSNSKKKKREYLLQNYILANEREIVVKEENGFDAYYPVTEIKKIEFAIRSVKKNTIGNPDFENLFSNENEMIIDNLKNDSSNKSINAEYLESSKVKEIVPENNFKTNDESINSETQSSINEIDKTVKNVPKELLNEDMVLHKENKFNPIEKPYENKFEVPEKKKLFKEFKRAKSSSKRDPFKPKKAIRTKSAGILFLIALLLLSLSGVFGFINSKATSSELRSVKTSIDKNSNSLEVVEKETLSIPLTAAYIEPFVTQYMTISDDFEENQKRNDSLKKYLAFNYDFEKSTSDKRVLKSQEIYNIQENEEFYVVQVKVQYGVGNSDSRNSKTTNEGLISKEALLNIPVIFEKGKFTIIDLPYFSNFDSLQLNKAIELPSNIEGANAITVEEATKIDKFIDQFLTKYATGKKEDLAYMMQYPETLNGLYEFKESTNKIFIKDEKFHVLTLVIFKDSSSSIEHSENMKLEIVLKDGKYFVEKLDHNLGGIK